MKVFFDTSVLTSAFFKQFSHHEPSVVALAQTWEASVAGHSLAEFYATATRMPIRPGPVPAEVLHFLRDFRERSVVVSLTSDEYFAAIEEFCAAGHIGAGVYDFLIARCALKAEAGVICTWNVRHFNRFGAEITSKVQTPAELLRS